MSRRSTRAAAGSSDMIGLPASQTYILPNISTTVASSTGFYLQSHYNHPATNRLYLGPNLSHTSGKGHHGSVGSAVPKPPKPPEKPLMPYMRYSRKVWDEVKANNPELKLWEIGKIIGQMWRELAASDKQLYIEEYEGEKMAHLDMMKSYHNSSAYQSYLHAKSRAEALEASSEGLGTEKDDAYMSIEPVDDTLEELDAGFSVKHVAAARFQRNHRLINDILGEAIHVPNMRAVVTTNRSNVLKNQVQSLQSHQKKLEAELTHIEKTHINTKRKWREQAIVFAGEMKRLCSMSPQEYHKEWKQKQQQLAAAQQQSAASSEAQKSSATDDKQAGGKDPEVKAESSPDDVEIPASEESKTTSSAEKDKDDKKTEEMEVEESTEGNGETIEKDDDKKQEITMENDATVEKEEECDVAEVKSDALEQNSVKLEKDEAEKKQEEEEEETEEKEKVEDDDDLEKSEEVLKDKETD